MRYFKSFSMLALFSFIASFLSLSIASAEWDYRRSYGYNDDWKQTAQNHFTQFDTNRDGAVSRGEWQGAGEKFEFMDINRDGFLTQQEFFRAEVWIPQTPQSASPTYPTPSSNAFKKADRNNDGIITIHEWAGNRRSYEILDRNLDGVVRREEFYDPRGAQAAAFAQMDTNNDGVISRNEWRGNDNSFRKHDWNRDGVLSIGEMNRSFGKKHGYGGQPMQWNTGWSNYSQEWRQVAQRHFTEFDTNRDGAVSRGEWQGASEKFARMDTNRDGFLVYQEFFRMEEWNSEATASQATSQTTSTSGTTGENTLEQLLLQILGQTS
jgi:Ca2+-binding EF-hand superfamily protein